MQLILEAVFGYPPSLLLALVAAVFFGAMVQNLTGLGFGMVSSPIVLLLDPSFVPAVILMLGFSSSFHNMLANRRLIDFKQFSYATSGRLFGTICGALLLALVIKGTDTRGFALLFAAILLVSVAMSVAGSAFAFFKISKPSLTFFGFLSGLFATITAVGGPPLALVYQHAEPEFARTQLHANLGIGALLGVVALAISGLLTTFHLLATLFLLPVVALGVLASIPFRHRLKRNYRHVILAIVTLSALGIIFRTI